MTYNYSHNNNRQIGVIPIALVVKGAITLLPQLIPFITNAFKAPARDANRLIDGIKPNIANIDPRERLGIVLATAQKIPYEARDVMAEKLMLWYKINYPNDYKVLLPEDKEFYNNFLASQIQQFPDGNNFWGNSRNAMFTSSEVNYNATPINTITNLFQPLGSNKSGISPIFLLAIVGGAIFLFTRKKRK
jgi:hypothetical protein